MKRLFIWTLAVVIGCLLILGFLLWEFPYLSPLYRNQYSPEQYLVLKDTSGRPRNDKSMMQMFEHYYPYWLGSSWDFNGTSETPGKGEIACGYFVTTVLRDMHFDIQRVALAQATSEHMIKTLADLDDITRYGLTQNKLMFSFIKSAGANLYIIGLDTHTGFVYFDGQDIWFIHSSGSFPYRVVKVHAEDAKTILHSNYKVLGCISKSSILQLTSI